MSQYYTIAKENFTSGYWTEAMLRKMVDKGKLTAPEFAEITGKDY